LAVAATTRRAWQYRHVPTRFLTVEPGERLGAFLERARRAGAERVMLLGPAPDPAWLLSDPGPWQPDDRGHYLDTDQLCARYVMRSTLPPRIVARMELRRAVSWFGDGDYSAEVAMQAWATLEELIREVRGWETARLLGSPTVTGRDLWRRTIRPGASFPLLEVDQAALIRSTSPQARIQLVEPQRGELAEFHYLDMRLAYGALTRELPVGPARHDVATPGRPLAVQPYAAARYLVEFTAPAGWPWVGAFMVPGDEGRYTFPLAGVCWADCWEVENAVRHGWRVVVRERLSFDKGRPLDAWTGRLVSLRDKALMRGRIQNRQVAELVGRALRFLILYTIGAFHAAGRDVTHAVQTPAEISAESWRVEKRGDMWVWIERQEPSEDARAAMHPHWSAAVWARCRTRLLCGPTAGRPAHASGAWHVDPAQVVALWLDAIYLGYDPVWADDGRPGRWRHKGVLSGPLPAPKTLPAVSALRKRAETAQGLSGAPTAVLERQW